MSSKQIEQIDNRTVKGPAAPSHPYSIPAPLSIQFLTLLPRKGFTSIRFTCTQADCRWFLECNHRKWGSCDSDAIGMEGSWADRPWVQREDHWARGAWQGQGAPLLCERHTEEMLRKGVLRWAWDQPWHLTHQAEIFGPSLTRPVCSSFSRQ